MQDIPNPIPILNHLKKTLEGVEENIQAQGGNYVMQIPAADFHQLLLACHNTITKLARKHTLVLPDGSMLEPTKKKPKLKAE